MVDIENDALIDVHYLFFTLGNFDVPVRKY